jgi:tRNA U34 5-carboxymethylaminomethyl modifying GTPase MnmE/TrmE
MTGDLPGLTRDPVREGTLLDGYPYELIDTAGEGEVADALARRALDLARRARRDGLLLLVVDGGRGPSASDRAIRNDHTVVVRNKSDLPAASWPDDFPPDVTLSCRADLDAAAIRHAVGAALRRLRALPPAGPVGGPAALDDEELEWLQRAHDRSAP